MQPRALIPPGKVSRSHLRRDDPAGEATIDRMLMTTDEEVDGMSAIVIFAREDSRASRRPLESG